MCVPLWRSQVSRNVHKRSLASTQLTIEWQAGGAIAVSTAVIAAPVVGIARTVGAADSAPTPAAAAPFGLFIFLFAIATCVAVWLVVTSAPAVTREGLQLHAYFSSECVCIAATHCNCLHTPSA